METSDFTEQKGQQDPVKNCTTGHAGTTDSGIIQYCETVFL